MGNLTNNRRIEFIRANGGYFSIIGATSTTLSTLIAFLWNFSVNPNFNIVSYAVSDLVSGPVISGVIYTIGLLVSSLSQIPTYISLIRFFNNKEGHINMFKVLVLSSIFSIISHIILSLVPLDRNNLIMFLTHGIAAGIHYVTGSISLILIGIFELLELEVSKIITITSFIVGTLYSIVWIRFFLSLIVGIPDIFMNYAIQWVAFAVIILWTFFHGIFLIRTKKRKKGKIRL